MNMRLTDSSPQEDFAPRFAITALLLMLMFSFLLGRIWHLQIFNGRTWRIFSDKNRIEIRRIPALRGRILDRYGIVMADSRPSFDLMIKRGLAGDLLETTLDALFDLVSIEEVEQEGVRKRVENSPLFDWVVLKRDLTRDQLALILARQYAFPGIEILATPARAYPFGTHGSHVLGYLGEIGREDLAHIRKQDTLDYALGDVWGISGLEKKYESILRGRDGANPVVQDVRGREIGRDFGDDILPAFSRQEPIPGHDLVLTIDAKLQEVAEEAFTHPVGALVAMDPNQGDILTLVSKPEYDPARFVRGVSASYWRELQQDPNNPLYDRALRGLYPPGSTFKMITAIAALEEQVIDLGEAVFCPGYYRLGRETKRCWRKTGHGWTDFHRALVESCDVYFYEVGKRLGIERIAQYAKSFGLGSKTGIGINRESEGLVPTNEWKKRVYGTPWFGGETLSVAIGQGAVQTTPLQMAVALSALVNGGKVLVPRVALRSQSLTGEVQDKFDGGEKGLVMASPENREIVIRGLDGVVNDLGGTGYWSVRSKFVRIGGKTGTAQVVSLRSKKKIEDHAWFIAFAPVENPQIVVSVIVEQGGHGGAIAGPIAKKVIEAYLGEGS